MPRRSALIDSNRPRGRGRGGSAWWHSVVFSIALQSRSAERERRFNRGRRLGHLSQSQPIHDFTSATDGTGAPRRRRRRRRPTNPFPSPPPPPICRRRRCRRRRPTKDPSTAPFAAAVTPAATAAQSNSRAFLTQFTQLLRSNFVRSRRHCNRPPAFKMVRRLL